MDKNANRSLREIYAARRDRLKLLLRRRGLDALLVSQAPNRFYLSGFELHDPQPNESAGYLIICARGPDWLATDSRYAEAAARLWPRDYICLYSGDRIRDLCATLRFCGTLVGFEQTGISLDMAQKLKAAYRGEIVFTDAGGLVEKLRVIKDASEISALKNSFAINHRMFAWLSEEAASGRLANITEKNLSWQVERFFREHGAQELAFATIAATGINGALPHAVPDDIEIRPESPLLVDAGCRADNYCSDQTRVFWIGKSPAREYISALELVQKAQRAAMDIMRPGVACADVYSAAWEVFRKNGVEKAFTHGLGHGVGLETHEAPSLSPRSTQLLQEGMVVTVEPGLYYPAWGGVRWEHTVLVEADGIQVL